MWLWFIGGCIVGIGAMAPVTVYWVKRTIRQVKLLEQKTRSSERLAEQATMTGGLAHEIKNPLSTIGLNLQLIQETLDEMELPEPASGRLMRRVSALASETERLRHILEDFLRFAGRMKLDQQPQDINATIEQLIDFYTPQADASGIQLRSQLDPKAGQVVFDVTLFKQALLNLMINATQAMVASRYESDEHGGGKDLMITSQDVGDSVVVHVIDTGPGIKLQELDKIFKPYYSSKRGGSGLGLTTSRRIIESHGGQIKVHTELGKGTDFQMVLPRTVADITAD